MKKQAVIQTKPGSLDLVLSSLNALARPENVEGMARFGITGKQVLGLSMAQIRSVAKELGRNHRLAESLVKTGIYEARLLAAFIADPKKLTPKQSLSWALEFECWADCDGFCIHLFRKALFAHELAEQWSGRSEELVNRAGFSLMATLAVHDKKASDATFKQYLGLVESASDDDRNSVRKSVNWALRQIGKRNQSLLQAATTSANSILQHGTRPAKWIARDALREFARVRKSRNWVI